MKKDELILNNREIATTFNNYFAEIVPSLNLFKWPGNVRSLTNNCDVIDSIVLKFHNHPSIKMIKNKFRRIAKFSFQQVTLVDVRRAIKHIRLDKSLTGNIYLFIYLFIHLFTHLMRYLEYLRWYSKTMWFVFSSSNRL